MEGAEKFFKRIKHDGLEPNVITYGTLIKGYAKTNDLETMMKKYEEMKLHGIKPNQTIYTTIMDAYGKNKDFGDAVIWFKEMESSGVVPDQKAKNILLSLANTLEEKAEANELVGQTDHSNDQHPVINKNIHFDDDEDDDDYEEDYADDEDEQALSSIDERINASVGV